MELNSVSKIMWASRLVYKSVKLHGRQDDFNIPFYIDKLKIALNLMEEELDMQKKREEAKKNNIALF